MKRLLAILLAVCMVLSLAACGGDSGSDATNPGGNSTPTQGSQGGDSKDPATQPTTQDDPNEGDDPEYSDDEDETTEPTQAGTDLSDVPNPLGLNSLILAAYLNNCGTYNYSTDEINKRDVTRDMLNGIRSLSISGNMYDEGSTLTFYTIYVANLATAASEEDYEYEYVDLICKLDFVPDFSGDALQILLEDLKDCKLTQIKLENLPISDLRPMAMFPELDWVSACYCENLTSLAGLENLTKLTRLDCHSGYALEDISALTGLTNLESIELGSNSITDLTPLAGLVNLENLTLGGNPITDMSPLANLPALKSLGLGSTDIEVIPEGGTTAVTYLSLGGYDSDIRDVKNIAQWVSETKSVQVDIPFEKLDSFEGLELVPHIDFLSIYGETITNEDMEFLGKLHVKQLQITGTSVTDLSAFAGNETIESLTITTPALTDLSPLASCPNLSIINASQTGVTDVSGLAGMESLTRLDLTRTPITDLSSIAGIPNLEALWLNRNEQITDVSALVNCPNLQYLYLYMCTGITDISPLASSTTLKLINIAAIEGLDTSAFDGTEIEIRDYY